jgi:chaperonin GroES
MAIFESTIGSQLEPLKQAVPANPLDDEAREAEIEERAERPPAPKPKQGSILADLIEQIDDINLARHIDAGERVVEEYEIDENSRSEWVDLAETAMKFAIQTPQEKDYPWPKSSNFIWPLITQATIDFAARTYPAIVQGRNVVKGTVWGSDDGTPITQDSDPDGQPLPQAGPGGQQVPVWKIKPGEKRERADKIGEHMSWQLLVEMPEWEPQTDQMLHQMPVIGGGARKSFRDPVADKNKSLFVSLLNLVWNYHAPSFEAAPRHTEKVILYPNEIIDLERSVEDDKPDSGGMFLPMEYGPGGTDGETFNGKPIGSSEHGDSATPQLFIEQHRLLDLDGDGYEEPYIVTVHLRSRKVVRIVARYDAEGIKASKDGDTIYQIKPNELYTLYPFLPSIDGGSYPMGFGQLLRPLNEGINTSLNQLFDAGHLANTGSGFVSDQLGMPSGQTLVQVGKFTRVTTKGQDIRASVYPIPWPGPNPVLFQVLGALIEASEKIAGVASILTGDADIANAPPTTVLALIEQGMKFYTAIVKRVFRAEKAELAKLYELNRKHIKEDTEYQWGDESKQIAPEDYAPGGGVEPVADPTQVTDMQRLGRAQILMSAKDEPGIDRLKVLRRLFEAANIDQIDDLFTPPDPNAAALQQMQMAMLQAELGVKRADELKNQTQAFLNMALARKNASAAEMGWIEAQQDFMRLHIEALNTSNNAALIDHKFHQTRVDAVASDAERTASAAEQERQHAHEMALAAMQPPPGAPTPGPTGPFPVEPSAPTGPDVVSPSSPGTGTPAVPGGPSGPGNPAAGGM